MKVVIDGAEYELLSEQAVTGDFRVKREDKIYLFERENLEIVARVYRSKDAINVTD